MSLAALVAAALREYLGREKRRKGRWGKSVAFWRALGFQLDDDSGTSGMLRPRAGGPCIYLAEVPADRKPAVELYLSTSDETAPDRPAEVVAPFAATHWERARWRCAIPMDGS